MSIEIKQINKAFGRTPVLNDISGYSFRQDGGAAWTVRFR